MTEENTENTSVDDTSDTNETQIPEVEKFTVKINGEEKQVTKDELIKDYQIREASYERMKKAESLKDEVKPYLSVVRALKKGDLSVLKELGLKREDVINFSESQLKEYIEEQQLSPEAREAKEAKAEAEVLRREKEAILAEKAAGQIESDIIEAFQEHKILMKGNHRLIRRVAEDMYGDDQSGYQPSAKKSLKKVLKTIEQEYLEHVERSLTSDDADKFLDSLPTKLVDGIRKKGLKQVRSQMPISKVSDTEPKPKSKSPISDDLRSYMQREMRKRG